MKNKKVILATIAIFFIAITGYVIIAKTLENKPTESLTTTDIDTKINTDDDDEKINWDNLETHQEIINETMEITKDGTYTLSGDIEGSITINTTGNVKLIFNNVNIKSNNGPAIIAEQVETLLIYLEENSNNYLEDSDDFTNFDEDFNGVIYSKDDIVFDGTGNLTIKSNYQDGIVSKDDLKIINGNYTITSVDDAIRGKDSIYIKNGIFNITSGGDGLKTTNEEDIEKGYILIENGTFNIESDLDGISAITKLVTKNGNFNITTGGGSKNSSIEDSWGNWGPGFGYGPGGQGGHGPGGQGGHGPGGYGKNNRYEYMPDTKSDTTESAKGLKAGNNLVIENGTFTFDTSDDAIHSNNYTGITNGKLSIASGDDGIHADKEIIIDNGKIDITKSYEGIESAKITINNGEITLVSTDDGINVAGGMDNSGMNRPGQNNYDKNTNNILTFNNGKIYIDATGDGIDVNGSAYIYDGEIIVDGPTNSGNGSLDYDYEFIVNGGTFIATGSSGMMQSISSSSSQYNLSVILNSNYQNKEIKILDENNTEILSYTPSKSFSSIVISSKKFKRNNTYKILIDNKEYETFTINSITTIIGNNQMMQNGPGPRR